MTNKLLNFSEAREYLNVTNGHLRSLIFKKQIGFIKIGRLIRFDHDDLVKWIEGQKQDPKECSMRK